MAIYHHDVPWFAFSMMLYLFIVFPITSGHFWAFYSCSLYFPLHYTLFLFSFGFGSHFQIGPIRFHYKYFMYLAWIKGKCSPHLRRLVRGFCVVFCISALRFVPPIASIVLVSFTFRSLSQSNLLHSQNPHKLPPTIYQLISRWFA